MIHKNTLEWNLLLYLILVKNIKYSNKRLKKGSAWLSVWTLREGVGGGVRSKTGMSSLYILTVMRVFVYVGSGVQNKFINYEIWFRLGER